MKRRKISDLLVTLLTLSAAMAGPAVGQRIDPPQHPNNGRGAIHRSLEWRQPEGGGQATGLYLIGIVPAGMITRILILSPGGRAIRITYTVDPRRGVQTGELLDDATGWWARLEERFGIRADSLGAYLAYDRWIWDTSAPDKVRLRFAASGASPVEEELPLTEPTVPYARFAEVLAASGTGGEVVARLPVGLAEAVLFLDTSLSPTPAPLQAELDNLGYAARGVFEVLAELLRAAPPEGLDVAGDRLPWLMSVERAQKGTATSDPAVLELTSRFRSVENADPLSDYLAAEVFGARHPPGR